MPRLHAAKLMRKNIERVLRAFVAGIAAKGDSKETCSTDGTTVYSYAMRIAWRESDGTVYVVPYIEAPTATTRSQVHACERMFPNAIRAMHRVDPLTHGAGKRSQDDPCSDCGKDRSAMRPEVRTFHPGAC